MKKAVLLLAGLTFAQFAFAEGKIEDVVGKLQEAKTATDPVPVLEQAKAEFTKAHAGPNGLKETVAGVSQRKQAANKLGAVEVKHRAEKALDSAIETAKAGNTTDLPSKIDAAIAEVHHTGVMSR